MLLHKQRNLCLRLQYILYLQYNKQWYQIVIKYILPNFLPFRTVAFRITNCFFNSYFSNFVIIINLVADNPNLSELERVDMSLRRLELRFGTKGGFLGEPDVRRYRYGPKLTSGSADAIRRFKVDLDNCALYASAYKKTEKLEGRFVLNLAKRILYTSPKNTFQKFYFPEKHLAETTLSRTYISLNVHFPEITFP